MRRPAHTFQACRRAALVPLAFALLLEPSWTRVTCTCAVPASASAAPPRTGAPSVLGAGQWSVFFSLKALSSSSDLRIRKSGPSAKCLMRSNSPAHSTAPEQRQKSQQQQQHKHSRPGAAAAACTRPIVACKKAWLHAPSLGAAAESVLGGASTKSSSARARQQQPEVMAIYLKHGRSERLQWGLLLLLVT